MANQIFQCAKYGATNTFTFDSGYQFWVAVFLPSIPISSDTFGHNKIEPLAYGDHWVVLNESYLANLTNVHTTFQHLSCNFIK